MRELIDQVRRHRAAVDTDPMVTLDEKAKILGRCAQTLALAYKLTGEAADLTEARIAKSPTWRRMQDRILEALRPWPEALRAVGAALEALDSDG